MAILRVREAFTVLSTGDHYEAGRLVDDSDPNIKGRERHFEPVEAAASRRSSVEQATAEPGERRSLPPQKAAPRKRAAKKEEKS